jgi:BirA family transcriptional regulator, biotin operon repressor / biotin---[acetyl-CoA-carboxylase] ligase
VKQAAPVDDLAPAQLAERLRTQRMGRPYRFLPVCDSTNDVVRASAAEGAAEGLLVVADAQTAGRGRQHRVWHSPPGQNLYFSLLLRPQVQARQAAPLTLLAGAALAEALARAGAVPRLRWPNDLLLPIGGQMRKAAGILMEMASEGQSIRYIVLGVGVNVNSDNFPPDLAERATSLYLAAGQHFVRGQILVDFLSAFESIYSDFLVHGPSRGLGQWRRYADLKHPPHVVREGIEGFAIDVEETGALLVRDARGRIHRLTSGEIA